MIPDRNIKCRKRKYYKSMKQSHLKEWRRSCYVSNYGNKWNKMGGNPNQTRQPNKKLYF